MEISMEKGLVHIYCGDGKGKTTAATGLAVRCAGAGGSILWFQFLKRDTSGERISLGRLENITLLQGYDKMKFTFAMTDEEKQEAALFYNNAMDRIKKMVQSENYDMLILDEVIGAVNYGYLDKDILLDYLKNHNNTEVVMTGRNAPDYLIDLADYVSEINPVKHPYKRGIKARKGIEY